MASNEHHHVDHEQTSKQSRLHDLHVRAHDLHAVDVRWEAGERNQIRAVVETAPYDTDTLTVSAKDLKT